MWTQIVRVAITAGAIAACYLTRGVDAKNGSIRSASTSAASAPDTSPENARGISKAPRDLVKSEPSAIGSRDLSTLVVLDFEGIGNNQQVASYYNGAAGPDKNYGVLFGQSAYGRVDSDNGGSGNFANEPSPSTVLSFPLPGDPTMTVFGGFTGLSFYYASASDVGIQVYSGPSGLGTKVADIRLPRTGLCGVDFPPCGDPSGAYGRWVRFDLPPIVGVPFAMSVRFTGNDLLQTFLIDNMAITAFSLPPKPPTASPTPLDMFPEPPTSSPTKPPTSRPTSAPTKPPTSSPTEVPTSPPTSSSTTAVPTRSPTPAPTACSHTTYWVWDPTTDTVVGGPLVNGTARCIKGPYYNLEVRPCTIPATRKVQIQLKNSTFGMIKGQPEYDPPYFLWGDTTATGDVLPNTKPLPPGTYWLYTTMDGKVETLKIVNSCAPEERPPSAVQVKSSQGN